MDDLTRRRLSKDHEALRSAAVVDIDMNLKTPALNHELARLGVPGDADLNIPSVLIGLPGGMMMSRGLGLDQIRVLLELGMSVAPSEPYDMSIDFVEEGIEAFIKEFTPGDQDDLYSVPTWVRMFRNAFCEMVFAIEDVVDVDKTPTEIMDISKNACSFMLETMYIAANPVTAS